MADLLITGAQSIQQAPTANPPVWSSAVVNVTDQHAGAMEFAMQVNMTATMGSAQTDYTRARVAMFAGVDAAPTAGDVWAYNGVINLQPGFAGGFIGLELDFNLNGTTDFNNPPATNAGIGVWVGGSSNTGQKGNAGFACDGLGQMWHAGFVVSTQAVKDNSFLDLGTASCSYRMGGHHSWGIDTVDAVIDSQAALRVKSGQGVHNVNSGKTAEWSLLEGDDAGNVYVGKNTPGRVRVDKAVVVTSDRRLKKDIEPWHQAGTGLDMVMEVEPHEFRYRDDPDLHVGFIAQDIAALGIPGAVQGEGTEILSLDPMALIATLWRAVRELKHEVDVLKLRP